MGYDTDFMGEIWVTPALPDEWVKRWNDATNGDPAHQYVSGGRTEPAGYVPTDIETIVRTLDDGRVQVRAAPVMLFGWPREIDGVQQPQEWCNWELTNDNPDCTTIRWDGGEKFYEYTEWLDYLVAAIRHDFPGSTFDGEIEYRGEEWDDVGTLVVSDDGMVSDRQGSLAVRGALYTTDDVDELVEAARALLATRNRMVMWEHSELRAAGNALEAALLAFPERETAQ